MTTSCHSNLPSESTGSSASSVSWTTVLTYIAALSVRVFHIDGRIWAIHLAICPGKHLINVVNACNKKKYKLSYYIIKNKLWKAMLLSYLIGTNLQRFRFTHRYMELRFRYLLMRYDLHIKTKQNKKHYKLSYYIIKNKFWKAMLLSYLIGKNLQWFRFTHRYMELRFRYLLEIWSAYKCALFVFTYVCVGGDKNASNIKNMKVQDSVTLNSI